MDFTIPIGSQTALFKKHLDEEFNDRIIFSGAFGIGKTYFLDKYFAPENSDYLTVKLAPINYSISSNEDIFRLIKYDILFELGYVHGLVYQGEPVSRDVAYGTILPSNVEAIAKTLLELLPELNKSMSAIPIVFATLTSFATISKEIEKQRNITGKTTDATDLGDAVADSYQFESDYATEFIENSLDILAVKKGAKYKVLVIDDLDRIDPEHIFRLFNIFSAHLDYNKTQRNKFGFDKVIFVCDIENVRNIFHTRYGTETDFTGYIDKFFSQEIFFFNNKEAIASAVQSFINGIRPSDESAKYYLAINVQQGRNPRQSGLLSIILTELILSGALKMRRFKANYGMAFSLSEKFIETPSPYNQRISLYKTPAAITIEILSRILGGGQILANAIEMTSRYRRSNAYREFARGNNDWLLGQTIPIVDWEKHGFRPSYHSDSNYQHIGINDQSFGYKLSEVGSRRDEFYAEFTEDISLVDFFPILHEAVLVLLRQGIIT